MDVKSIAKQLGDRQSMFKKAKDGTARKPMKNRRHDNTLVLGAGKNGAWTPHDLRRTGATLMQRLKVPLDIVDRCQNRVLAGSKLLLARHCTQLHLPAGDFKFFGCLGRFPLRGSSGFLVERPLVRPSKRPKMRRYCGTLRMASGSSRGGNGRCKIHY